MTLTSAGFPGSVDHLEWSRLVGLLGYEGGTGFQLSAGTGGVRRIFVSSGRANVCGVLADSDAQEEVLLPANNGVSWSRIDSIILRASWSSRTLVLTSKTGTPASSPQPPDLTQVAGSVWELEIGQVTVAPGVGNISAGDITYTLTPPAKGFYRISQLATAPRPTLHSPLIWYTAQQSLRVAHDGAYIEVAHGRGVPQPQHISSNIDLEYASATPTAGSTPCGMSFTAPPSGKILVTINGRIESPPEAYAWLGFEIRTGGTVGSGSVFSGGSADSTRAIGIGSAAGPVLHSGSYGPRMILGLTPGGTYNIRTMHWRQTAPGTGSIQVRYRYILVDPVLDGQ